MSEIAARLWWIRHAPVAHGGRICARLDLSCDCSEPREATIKARKPALKM